jgi:uncharacterized MAPEG superfamily protein
MVHVALPIVAVGVMPYLLTGLSKAGRFSTRDNEQTRLWQAELRGWRQRAFWAHQNAFEAIPLFAALVLAAYLAHAGSAAAAWASWGFVALRVAYAACYIAGAGRLRSTVWIASQALLVVPLLVALSII